MRIERLRKEHGVQIKWVHFPLHPDTPAQGRSLAELFDGRGFDIPRMQAQMRERMAAEGLPYGDRTMTYNSRLAQELGAWADTQPGGDAIHDALFRAYFVDSVNIGDIDALVGIAAAVGLSARLDCRPALGQGALRIGGTGCRPERAWSTYKFVFRYLEQRKKSAFL